MHPGSMKPPRGQLHQPSQSADPSSKLDSMEQYCKKQYIFFNENDRIKYSIKKSKCLFQEFKGTLNRGFKNIHTFEDHPKLKILLEEE